MPDAVDDQDPRARGAAMLADSHEAIADLLGAASPAEIVFGANMTTLTSMRSTKWTA